MDKFISQNIFNLRLTLDEVPASVLGQSTILDQRKALKKGRKDRHVNEMFIIQKCNCVELYFAVNNDQKKTINHLIQFWERHAVNLSSKLQSKIVIEKNLKVALHLFRVAAGLESLLVGDAQVLGQIRSARKMAEEERTIGPVLRCLLKLADIAGSRTRGETKLCFGNVSISGATSEVICELSDKNAGKILIIGMGKMGKLIATTLAEKLPKKYIFVCNRTRQKALAVANKYGLNLEEFSNYPNNLGKFKVVIFALDSPLYTLTPEIFKKVKIKNKKLTVIDIGNPQSVDPKLGSEKKLALLNLDYIRSRGARNLAGRQKEALKAQEIVQEELELFKKAIKKLGVERLIATIYSNAYNRGARYRQRLKKIFLDFDTEQKETIENLSFGLVTKALIPIATIRNLAEKDFDKAVEIAKFLTGQREEKC